MASLDRFDHPLDRELRTEIDEAECQWCGKIIEFDGLCDDCLKVLNEGDQENEIL